MILKQSLKPLTEFSQLQLLRELFLSCKHFSLFSRNDDLWKFCFSELWPTLYHGDRPHSFNWHARFTLEARTRSNWKAGKFALSALKCGPRQEQAVAANADEENSRHTFSCLLEKRFGGKKEEECAMELGRDNRLLFIMRDRIEIWHLPEGTLISTTEFHHDEGEKPPAIVATTMSLQIDKCAVYFNDGSLFLFDVPSASVTARTKLFPLNPESDVDLTLEFNEFLCVVEEVKRYHSFLSTSPPKPIRASRTSLF